VTGVRNDFFIGDRLTACVNRFSFHALSSVKSRHYGESASGPREHTRRGNVAVAFDASSSGR
jgi:hypothetical protein